MKLHAYHQCLDFRNHDSLIYLMLYYEEANKVHKNKWLKNRNGFQAIKVILKFMQYEKDFQKHSFSFIILTSEVADYRKRRIFIFL